MRRYLELDLLRTIALLMMIVYHLMFDLVNFHGWNIDIYSGGWWMFARSTAILFLLLSGITSMISQSNNPTKFPLRKFLRIGGAALLVSLATYLIDPQTFIRFGILHLIAIAALLVPFFAPLKIWNIVVGIGVIVIGMALQRDVPVGRLYSLLLPLGFTHSGFVTLDYFPIIPWFGVILIGMGMGYLFYVLSGLKTERDAPVGRLYNGLVRAFAYPSHHSLFIYLIHQPILLLLLWLIIGKWQQ